MTGTAASAYSRRTFLRQSASAVISIGLGGAMGGVAAAIKTATNTDTALAAVSGGTWQKLRDMTVYGNYGGPAITVPVTKASFQGFAGGPAFSDDSRYLYIPTQEGDVGVICVDTQSGQNTVLSYACSNAVYNNPRKSAQFKGYVAVNNSIVPQAQVLNGSTMAMANANWPKAFSAISQAVQIDSTYVYLAHDGTPGTLTATNIQSGATFTFQSSDQWSGVYGMEIDRANQRLVCCDNATGNLYLFNLALLVAGGGPGTRLATIPNLHVGVPNGTRLYAGNGNVIVTYDITTPTAPRPIGAPATYQAPARATGYGQLKFDRVHNLLYATWGDMNQSGTDVLAIGAGDALSLITTIPGWTQSGPGGSMSCPAVDTAVSPDGNKFALSSEGGGGGPGGTVIYDVSKVAAAGPVGVLQRCYANAETRQATTVASDADQWVYSTCRFSYEVHDPTDNLRATGSVGTLIGSRLQPFGTTAGGTDPTLRIAPGAAENAYDYLFQCRNGNMTPLLCYGDSTLVNTAWDGKYLSALVNAYGVLKIVTYAVGPAPSYALTAVAAYTGPSGTQGINGLFIDGACGVPGSTLWVSDSALGVMAFDVGRLGIIAPIVTADIPDRLVTLVAAPHIAAGTGGSVETPFTYQVLIAYFDAFGVCCGMSGLSNAVTLQSPSNALIVSGLPPAPPLSATLSVYGQYQYTTSPQIFGPSPVTGAVGLPASTRAITLASQHIGWFGNAPNVSGSFIPAAGGICEIRKASQRIYVSQGDLGIRVYNPATMRRTGQITATGDSDPTNNPLAAPGIDVYTDGSGTQWLMSPNYTSGGSHHGLVALNTTANPDNPPATYILTNAGGFTCRTYRTGTADKGVLMATLCGGVGFRYG